MFVSKFFRWFLVSVVVVLLTACGGGGSSGGNNNIGGGVVTTPSGGTENPLDDNKTIVQLDIQNLDLGNLNEFTLASSNDEIAADGTKELSLTKDDKDVVGLINKGGIPILLGRKFEGDSSVDVSLASSAEIFVLITPRFFGTQVTDPKELSKRIEDHPSFSLLMEKIKIAIDRESPCPMNPVCNYAAADVATEIANDLQIDDLYIGGN